jgi:hypothetical protein
MSIPEPILVVYSEPPKAIATTDLRQARVDEFLASRSLQPKIRKAYQADLRTFMDWCNLAWVVVSRRKVTQFKTFLPNHPANIQHIQSDLTTVAKANLKQFISDRGLMLDKAVLIADHISEQFQKLRDSYRLTQIQIGQFAGLNVYLSRFGSEVNGSIGMSISSGYEFNVDCHNPHSSILHVVRNAIAAKLTTAQETLERDRAIFLSMLAL